MLVLKTISPHRSPPALAEENGIPLREDPDLVTLLAQLELGTEIPANLYVAVAEVLAFAYMVSGKAAPPQAGEEMMDRED